MEDYKKLDLEDRILRYFQNKDIVKERKEENELLFAEIEQHFEQSSEEGQLAFQLPNGEYAVLERKAYVGDVFDKDTLANELLIAKDEMKTPFDYSLLTAKGKLTPDMISKHTRTTTNLKLKITKRKTKPKPKKG